MASSGDSFEAEGDDAFVTDVTSGLVDVVDPVAAEEDVLMIKGGRETEGTLETPPDVVVMV